MVLPTGENTWFVNYASSEDGQKNNWKNHIVDELVTYIDGNYRTVATKNGGSISGLSMGGYGAFMLALRHPDMFVSIGR